MAEPLKENINDQTVDLLATRFSRLHKGFDRKGFTESVCAQLPDLELKDRINLLADQMAIDLGPDYEAALGTVVETALEGIDGWAAWPLCSFLERHGVDSPVASLEAMPQLTTLWSCEFAIRPYLDAHLELTREYLRRWALDPDEAVRRLASEGTRPRLPWGPKVAALSEDPQIGLELLQLLRHDRSETVRRSVANHLNDVAKNDPDLVVDVLAQWTSEDDAVDDRMVRHALRTLVKQGHPGALALLGFTIDPSIAGVRFACSPQEISLGDQIELTAELASTSRQDQLLVVDFVIHHVKTSGETSPKVFKWTTERMAPGQTVHLAKRRRIQTASTRRYHAGEHRIYLQVAGQAVASTHFVLNESS
jgi:3-methyladenine DNA glycosylase AlkC